MKRAKVCGHSLWVPDNVADWDAVAGDSPWERERMDSIIERMGPGKVLYDVGAEHGWMSAIFALKTGCKMVLVEPTKEFWPNIKGCWTYNALLPPVATCWAFVDDAPSATHVDVHMGAWPVWADGLEAMAHDYAHLQQPRMVDQPPSIRLDWLANITGARPDGITIDVEGAELRVLRSMPMVLADYRPLLWISVHPDLMERDFGHTPAQLHAHMQDAGYGLGTLLRVDHEEHWLFEPL